MTFEEILKAREHRILKGLDQYQSFSENPDLHFHLEGIVFATGEKPLGIYRNSVDNNQNSVVITTRGLYVFLTGWRFLEYEELASAHVPLEEGKGKTTADTLILRLRSGEKINISITGGKGQTRDVWSFDRFMIRIIEDYRKRASQ